MAELKQVDQKYGKKLTQMQEQHELVRGGERAGGLQGEGMGCDGGSRAMWFCTSGRPHCWLWVVRHRALPWLPERLC